MCQFPPLPPRVGYVSAEASRATLLFLLLTTNKQTTQKTKAAKDLRFPSIFTLFYNVFIVVVHTTPNQLLSSKFLCSFLAAYARIVKIIFFSEEGGRTGLERAMVHL